MISILPGHAADNFVNIMAGHCSAVLAVSMGSISISTAARCGR